MRPWGTQFFGGHTSTTVGVGLNSGVRVIGGAGGQTCHTKDYHKSLSQHILTNAEKNPHIDSEFYTRGAHLVRTSLQPSSAKGDNP